MTQCNLSFSAIGKFGQLAYVVQQMRNIIALMAVSLFFSGLATAAEEKKQPHLTFTKVEREGRQMFHIEATLTDAKPGSRLEIKAYDATGKEISDMSAQPAKINESGTALWKTTFLVPWHEEPKVKLAFKVSCDGKILDSIKVHEVTFSK